MPVTTPEAKLLIRSRSATISPTRFGEQAGIPYSRCGHTKAPYKRMNADIEKSWKERLIMNNSRRTIFEASVDW